MMTRRGFLLGTAAAGTLAATGISIPTEPNFTNGPTVGNHTHGMLSDDIEGELTGTVVDCRFDMPNRMELTIQLDDGRVVREVYRMGVPR